MIDTSLELGLTPIVTLHHFTLPAWFAGQGGWLHPDAVDIFGRYVEQTATILDGVEWVCTINEPNMVATMVAIIKNAQAPSGTGAVTARVLPSPDSDAADAITAAHKRAVEILHRTTSAKVGWTIANQQYEPTLGNEIMFEQTRYTWEDRYLLASRGDDFVGVQAYTSQKADHNGPVPHPPHPDNTMTGWAYRPDALEMALRHSWEVTGGVPMLVTENGIATDDDAQRIRYTEAALHGLEAAAKDGMDIRGYLHWSALDNYEWGEWHPTFGLIAVDRNNFTRSPKPSLGWLGDGARTNTKAAV
jgi:beta-glucosidase